MELKTLLYEKEAGIGIITLNRPKTLNALNDELIGELSMLLDVIAADPEVQAVIITGGEKAFAAGGDILFMSTADTLQAEKFVESVRTAFDKIYQLDKTGYCCYKRAGSGRRIRAGFGMRYSHRC